MCLTLVALAGISSANAAPAEGGVAIGEISIGKARPRAAALLRRALSEELSQSSVSRLPAEQRLIVSLALLDLSSERRGPDVQASAAVSLAVRRAGDQLLCAELRGRASTEQASSVAAAEHSVLRAAVRSAVARLPEAARDLKKPDSRRD